MSAFTIYELSTGRIVSTGAAQYPLLQGGRPGTKTLELASNMDKHYIDILDESLKDRVAMNLVVDKSTVSADGMDTVTVTGIPEGTYHRIARETPILIDDGVLEFTTDIPGLYFLKFYRVDYLDTEVRVDAT